MRTKMTPNTDTFHVVRVLFIYLFLFIHFVYRRLQF